MQMVPRHIFYIPNGLLLLRLERILVFGQDTYTVSQAVSNIVDNIPADRVT